MAKRIENECVGCPPEIGCLGSACIHKKVTRYYCDECKYEYEPDELYVFDGEELCHDCLFEKFQTVAQIEEKEC